MACAMSVAETIRKKLTDALAPAALEVIDQSHLHAHHAGAREHKARLGANHGSGESHFQVVIVSEAFSGKSRVDRQRLVNAVLADELAGPVHALAMKTLTPEEAERA